MSKNKMFIILGVISLVILIVVFAVVLLLRSKNQKEQQNVRKESISSERGYFPQIVSPDEMIYLAGQEQTFRKISLKDNQIIDNFPVAVPYVKKVLYSLDQQKVILKTFDVGKDTERYYVYNFSEKKLVNLEGKAFDAIWDDNNLVLRSFVDNQEQYYTASWDGTPIEKIDFPFDRCDQVIAYKQKTGQLICAHTNEDMSQNVFDIKENKQIVQSAMLQFKIAPDYNKILFVLKDRNAQWYDLTGLKAKETKAAPLFEEINWAADSTALIYFDVTKNDAQKLSVTNGKLSELFKTEPITDPMLNYNNSIYFSSDGFLYRKM